jgi:hypothetical protein
MYFSSLFDGQVTSFSPGESGMPTECTQGTHSLLPSASRAPRPMRVMIRMFTTT